MKKTLYMILLLAFACVVGGFIGSAAKGPVAWLGKSAGFSFEPGNFLQTDVLSLTFGISFNINVAQIILVIIAVFVYYKTAPKLIAAK